MIRTGLVGLIGLGGLGAGIVIKYRSDSLGRESRFRVSAIKPIEQQSRTNLASVVEQQNRSVDNQLANAYAPPKSLKRIEEIGRFGLPSLDTIRTYDNFILSYDNRNRIANWVLEHLNNEEISGQPIDRTNMEFFEDNSIHEYFRSTNSDYSNSGYDRGHLAAAANHRLDKALVAQTFVLSNICPQVGKGFNRDKWNELEMYCRNKVYTSDNIWVCTGPLFLPKRETDGKLYIKYEVIGKNLVSVPTHFFKVLLIEEKEVFHLESYIMPNEPIDDQKPIHMFRIPIDTIERTAGLFFFNSFPRTQLKTINGKSL